MNIQIITIEILVIIRSAIRLRFTATPYFSPKFILSSNFCSFAARIASESTTACDDETYTGSSCTLHSTRSAYS
jgi:hypothetical protein